MEDILKPKSKEEIMNELQKMEPNDLLIMSSKIGNLIGIELALKNGAKIDYGTWAGGRDLPLRWASMYGHKDAVELLLKNGANIHAEKDGALFLAIQHKHKDVIELLKKYGAKEREK